MRKSSILLFFISIIYITSSIYCSTANAQDNLNNSSPYSFGSPPNSSTLNLGTWLASFYKDYISPIDGSRCPSIPSCSTYSLRAFKKHGFFMGWLMTVDRLIHEGKEETAVSPVVYTKGKWKIFDPLKNNDFWWFQDDDKKSIQNE